jgi:hypothetical protein
MYDSVLGLAMMLYGFWLLYSVLGKHAVFVGVVALLIYRGYELLGPSKTR